MIERAIFNRDGKSLQSVNQYFNQFNTESFIEMLKDLAIFEITKCSSSGGYTLPCNLVPEYEGDDEAPIDCAGQMSEITFSMIMCQTDILTYQETKEVFIQVGVNQCLITPLYQQEIMYYISCIERRLSFWEKCHNEYIKTGKCSGTLNEKKCSLGVLPNPFVKE